MWKKWKVFLTKFFESERREIYKIPRFIDAESVLQQTSQGWVIGTRKLTQEELSILKLEAKDFGGSFLWQLMRNEIHYIAYLQATAKRHTEDDAIYGGAMYKNLEILERFIKQCKKL